MAAAPTKLDIQVDDFEGVFLNELAAVFDVFAHQRGKDLFGFDNVLELDLEERPGVRIHRGFPELRRIHLAKTLESRDGEIFLGVFHDVSEHVAGFFFCGLIAIPGNNEGRLVEFLNLFCESAEAFVFGSRGERPVNFLIVRSAELDFVEAVLFVEGKFAIELELGLLDFLKEFFERLLLLELGLLVEAAFGENFDQPSVLEAAGELGRNGIVFLNIEQERGETGALEGNAFLGLNDVVFGGAFHELTGKVALIANVALAFAALDAVKRRLSNVHMIALDEFLHVAEEESEEQGADVRTIDVRVGHENDLVVAKLAGVKIVLADTSAQGGDDGTNFFLAEHLVVAGLLDVKDFALEGKDGLIFAVTALLRGATGRFALNDEDLAMSWIAFLAIGEFSGKAVGIQGGVAAGNFGSLARSLASPSSVNALADDAASHGGVLVKPFAELFVDQLLDVALDVAVELALGLAFELGLREPHADNGNEAFTHIVARDGDFVLLLFQHAVGGSKVIDGTREGRAEAGEVRAAIDGVDGVGECENVLAVGVVVLEGDFDFDVAFLAFHVDRGIVEGGFAAVQVLDEFRDAAGEAELGGLFRALVGERNFQAFVEECVFTEASGDGVVAEAGFLEDGGIGMEGNLRASLAGIAGASQLVGGLALFVGLFPHRAIALDFEFEPIGKSVDDRDADTVEAAGHLVGIAVELSAGMENGHDDFSGRALFRGVHFDGNAATVVHNGDGIISVDRDADFVGKAGHGFVNGIVDHFPDQMVQTHFARGADVHGGTQANGFEAAEDFNGLGVGLVTNFSRHCFFVAHVIS